MIYLATTFVFNLNPTSVKPLVCYRLGTQAGLYLRFLDKLKLRCFLMPENISHKLHYLECESYVDRASCHVYLGNSVSYSMHLQDYVPLRRCRNGRLDAHLFRVFSYNLAKLPTWEMRIKYTTGEHNIKILVQ